MPSGRLPGAAVERLYRQARADRWDVPAEDFAAALERSARKAFAEAPEARELERYLASLHLEDLALACACANGHAGAWEHFIREHRPGLYRAADAIDSSGGSRELADSLYGELFGLKEREGKRRSHFEYFHGRSSLGTWLRAVLSQRHVDRVRSVRRFDELPSEETAGTPSSLTIQASEPPSGRLPLMQRLIAEVVASLVPKDRLRLACYYAQDLTLAQIGTALGEHEATVSRNLSRVRKEVRTGVERRLRETGMNDAQVAECFASAVDEAGSLDVTDLLGEAPLAPAPDGRRKEPTAKRSKGRAEGASA